MARLLGVLAAICAGVALNLAVVQHQYAPAAWVTGVALVLWVTGETVADNREGEQ